MQIGHEKCQITIHMVSMVDSSKVCMFDIQCAKTDHFLRCSFFLSNFFFDFQLKRSEVENLYKLYAADFEMFGYSPADYISIARPGWFLWQYRMRGILEETFCAFDAHQFDGHCMPEAPWDSLNVLICQMPRVKLEYTNQIGSHW